MRLPSFKLERYFSRYEFKAPYIMCASDCESVTINELLALQPGSLEEFKELWLGYTETEGHPDLRAEIARLYQVVEADEILVHAGAEEAIFIFMNVALEPGDHVIVHYPGYQSLFAVAKSLGCEITRWRAREEDNWELDIDFLRKSIKKNTRAIVVNCPHNPTGYLMSKDKWRQVMEIAREYKLLVFSDEVYRFLEYDHKDQLPAAADLYEKGVSLGVMSKSFGLAGLRIGWVAARDRSLLKKMASFKDYTTICSSAPSEFLAALALRNKEAILRRNLDLILNNLKEFEIFFANYPDVFQWRPPKAGPIAFPRLKLKLSSDDFCHDLVEKHGVLLLPSSRFDFGHSNFRIGFGRKNLPSGLERIESYLKTINL